MGCVVSRVSVAEVNRCVVIHCVEIESMPVSRMIGEWRSFRARRHPRPVVEARAFQRERPVVNVKQKTTVTRTTVDR